MSERHYRTCHLCDQLMKPGQRQDEFKLVTGDVVNVHQVCIDTEPEDDNSDPFEFVREQAEASNGKPGKPNPTVELVKEEPPPRFFGRASVMEKVREQLEHLRSDPGTWYRVLDYQGNAQRASSGRSSLLRVAPEGFDFVARRGFVYARFIG